MQPMHQGHAPIASPNGGSPSGAIQGPRAQVYAAPTQLIQGPKNESFMLKENLTRFSQRSQGILVEEEVKTLGN